MAQGWSRGDGEESDETIESDIYSNNYGTRILNGALVAPAMLSLPLYGIGFGLFGSKVMWAFSDCVYKCSRPCEGYLHRHFGNMQKSLFLKKKTRIAKSWGYRLHPTFAVLSLITTALSAFRQDMFHSSQSVGIFLPSYEGLVALNMSICFISMVRDFYKRFLMSSKKATSHTYNIHPCISSRDIIDCCQASYKHDVWK